MANNLSASFPEIWSKEQQEVFYKENVAMMIADLSFKAQMSRGDVLNRPYRSARTIQSYTRGTAITIDDLTDTNEQLTINREFATGFYLDNFDKIQSNYDTAASYGRDDGEALSNQVDAEVLGEYASALSTVDDGDIGGTSGNGIVLTTSNVLAVVGAAKRKLKKQNIPMTDLIGVISPEFEEILIQYGAGRDTNMGDTANDNGFFTKFYGFKLYNSNQLAGTAVLALATQPTAADTVTIEGVVFTFVDPIGVTAGNVLIGANVDVTRASLAGLINSPSVTSATQVALSLANQRLFESNFTATNDNALNTLSLVAKGVGVLNVSETLTDATDTWTTTKQIQHNLFGRKGAITLVMQSETQPQIKDVPDKLGKNILNGVLFGVETFADGAKQLVDVKVASSTFI